MTALKAKEFHQRDVHYIVKDGQVQIVDEVWEFPAVSIFAGHLCILKKFLEIFA
jgi:hypothetical protein